MYFGIIRIKEELTYFLVVIILIHLIYQAPTLSNHCVRNFTRQALLLKVQPTKLIKLKYIFLGQILIRAKTWTYLCLPPESLYYHLTHSVPALEWLLTSWERNPFYVQVHPFQWLSAPIGNTVYYQMGKFWFGYSLAIIKRNLRLNLS